MQPLAERIALLLKNEELRKELGKTGRLKFEKKYTLSHFENNIKKCLEVCISEKYNFIIDSCIKRVI